jgi:hypothetical protein
VLDSTHMRSQPATWNKSEHAGHHESIFMPIEDSAVARLGVLSTLLDARRQFAVDFDGCLRLIELL